MPELFGVQLTNEQLWLVEEVLNHARSLAGPDCVYGCIGQASKPEVRAALIPGDGTSKGSGVFLMIANTGKRVVVRRGSRYSSGHPLQPLMLVTLRSVINDVSSWHAEAVAKTNRNPVARNPAWTRDELILALDLYFRLPPWTVNASHSAIRELSETLGRLAATDRPDAERYRNVNGVYMKLMNLQHRDPTRAGRGLKGGGALESEVWQEFGSDREKLRRIAATIRTAIAEDSPVASELNAVGPVDELEEAKEGAILTRLHRVRERSRHIIQAKKNEVMRRTGALKCEVCRFDFQECYGQIGLDYIECHHLTPLANLEVSTITKLVDLAVLCSNCHRMIHRRRQWLSIEELQSQLH